MADAEQGSGWDEHERAQRRAWSRLSPRQRLDWLWKAKDFARRAEDARRRRVAAVPTRGADGDGEG